MNIFGKKTTPVVPAIPSIAQPGKPTQISATPVATRAFGPKKKVLDRRIPTVVGVAVLVLGLVAGGLLFSQGTGVFAPRATPQTTPKSIKLTNVTESSFTVTYLTDAASEGSVKYGTDPETPSSRNAQVATDDRVQLGTSPTSQFQTHHITIRGLQPNTQYYYLLSSSGEDYDNSGQAFTVTTAQRSGAPAAAKTIYGSVTTDSGTPADGAIVYVAFEGAGLLSSLVKQSGSWAVPLSNARTPDGSGYAEVTDSTQLSISVQGPQASQIATASVPVSQAQPVATLAYGQTAPSGLPVSSTNLLESPTASQSAGQVAQTESESESTASESASTATASATTSTIASGSAQIAENNQSTATESAITATSSAGVSPGGLTSLLQDDTPPKTTVDTTTEVHQVITTTTPVITGTAAPNVVVSIEVNSETQIQQQVTAGADGSFELDLEALKRELEPGEHTVTYSYTDPATGELVNKTISFTVTGTENQIAQATLPSPTPFGTGNPVPLVTSPSPAASVSATPSPSATATAQPATRSGLPSTASGVPKSGTVGTTFALVFGGLFFIISGLWSFWIAQQVEKR